MPDILLPMTSYQALILMTSDQALVLMTSDQALVARPQAIARDGGERHLLSLSATATLRRQQLREVASSSEDLAKI